MMPDDLVNDARLKTFKQIDELHHCAKGSAFRIFKQLSAAQGRASVAGGRMPGATARPHEQWVEGEHFYCIDSRTQPALFAQMQRSGRLYAATVNAVLITEVGYQAIAQILANTYDN